MKGLVLKDLFVLTRQMRVFFLLIVIFSVIPGMNMTAFAVVYAAMMPYTALAYDERSHWDELAGTMPYTVWDLVVSKYLLGWIFMGGAVLLALAAGAVERSIGLEGCTPAVAGLSLCAGAILMAFTLPLMLRFGVERGRMFFILMMVIVACGSVGLVSGVAASGTAKGFMSLLTVVLPISAAVLTAVSIPLSVRMYARRGR